MTIRLPQPTVFDQLLHLLGKKRGVILPTKAHKAYGPYVYANGKKENFWKALLRSKSTDLPKEMIDIFDYHNTQKK